jgi:group I intron endonuclease
MGIVYIATCSLGENKKYIGFTTLTLPIRRCDHEKRARNGSLYAFHCAIRKYGISSFTWKVVYRSKQRFRLVKAEVRWIKRLNTKSPHGYNLTDGGEGNNGLIVTDATRKKQSLAKKRWMADPSNREKMGEALRQAFALPSVRRKMRESHLGKTLSKEARAKVSLANKGKVVSKATVEKISKAKKSQNAPETQAKRSLSAKMAWVRRKERQSNEKV